MKLPNKCALSVLTMTATCLPATAADFNFNGSNVYGLHKSIVLTDVDQTTINVSAGIAWDPTSTDGSGNYNRVYLVNRSDANVKRGLYAIDTTTNVVSSRLALGGDSSNDLDSPYAVAVDSAGHAYVAYSNTPSLWRVENPMSGTPIEVKMLGDYSAAGFDDDPISVSVAQSGNIILFDNGLDSNGIEAISVVGPSSTEASPVVNTVWYDSDSASDNNIRGAYSNHDHYAYVTTGTLTLQNGTAIINRIDESGNLDTILLSGITSALNIDDAIAVNPADGSIWFAIADGSNRTFYRVDVASATEVSPDLFEATVTTEFTATSLNMGANGLAFSPDGQWLAFANPDGVDTMYLLWTSPAPEPASLALLLTGGLTLLRRRSCIH